MKLKTASILLIVIVICSSVAGQGNTADGWIKKGWTLIDVESYTEAAECFEKAILLNSSSPEAWDGKGFALNGEGYKKDYAHEYTEARGCYEEAIRCFKRAIQLNSSYFNAYINGGTNGDTDLGGVCHLIEWIVELFLIVLVMCFIVRLADG